MSAEAPDPAIYLREWIGATIGGFALGDERITQSDLIEAVDAELIMGAESLAGIFDPQNGRLAELFCTP